MIFGLFSVVFYAGAIFYRDDGLPPLDMFTSIFAIMYAVSYSILLILYNYYY